MYVKEALNILINKGDLSYELAKNSMNEIMQNMFSDVQLASFLTALSLKKPTVNEVIGFVHSLKESCQTLNVPYDTFEIVGTGADGSNSFNISTCSAIVLASCGLKISKHGSHASTSLCGSADVLEELGVNIDVSKEKCEKLLNNIGICFMLAKKYHPSMKHVAGVRKELGLKTVFNILGPLSNPANATMQLLGVYEKELVPFLADVLIYLGVKNGMVVYGLDRLDEISISDDTYVCIIKNGEKSLNTINPQMFGLQKYDKSEIVGGDRKKNAQIIVDILTNKQKGAKLDSVLINCGASLYIANLANSIQDGVQIAREAIQSGKSYKKLQEFIEYSKEA